MAETIQTPVKEDVIRMIQRLPDDCTLEDIQYHLYVRQRIEAGLKEAEQGETISQDDIEAEVRQWRKSDGPLGQGES